MTEPVRYGIQIGAKLPQELGFDAAWRIEHHFSDDCPTLNPLGFLSHLAAARPGPASAGSSHHRVAGTPE